MYNTKTHIHLEGSNLVHFQLQLTDLTKVFKDITTRILLWCPGLNNHSRRGSSSFPLLHFGASVLTLATNEASHEGLPLLWTMNLKTVQKHKTKSNNVFSDD